MKHLLYVTYGFSPINNMAAHRALLRVKALDRLGWRVSVVTRDWSGKDDTRDATVPSEEIRREALFGNVSVYRVPFGLPREGAWARTQRRLHEAPNVVARNLSYFVCPLDGEARLRPDPARLERMLDSRPDVVLASGAPWSCFELGRALAARFGARYVAEYRDAWGYADDRFKVEGNNSFNDNAFSQLKRRFALARERALNGGADLLVTVSEPLLQNARRVLGSREDGSERPGLVVTNGYDPDEVSGVSAERARKFTLTYIGTIYAGQRAEVFFEALDSFIERHRVPLDSISVRMIGSRISHGFDKVAGKISLCRHHERIVEYTDRLGKRESLEAQKSSHVLLYFAHGAGTAGIYSGKIFEYIVSGTPILFAPSDHGVVAELINRTRTGTVCDSVEETADWLEKAYRGWQATGQVEHRPDAGAVAEYSYLGQSRKLAVAIDAL